MLLTENRLSDDLTSFCLNAITDNLGDSFRDRYLRRHLMSKYADPDPSLSAARKNAAIEKWLKTDERNSRTNCRLYLDDEEHIIAGVRTSVILDRASRIIRRMIRNSPDLDRIYGSFSGGASTSVRRSPAGLALKFAQRPDVTDEAWDVIWPWLYRDSDLWLQLNPLVLQPRFVLGNVMFTVPKSDVIDRVACKEPDLNMFLQKGIGDYLRRCLKRVGIDLNDQSINQKLARLGSVDGELATVDLSSASDSVTTQLVMRLLPHDWFFLLDSVRCKTTVMPDGTLHMNEMFSSMGNAFTFELESLIFYALTKAVLDLKKVSGVVSVFGDDIIIPTRGFKVLRSLFGYVGFIINVSKSFYKGFTRESCGKHYHRGVDVTPFYFRRPVTTITELIRILNRLRRWTATGENWCRADWWETWCLLADQVPSRKLFGGYNLDSIDIVSSLYGEGYRLCQRFVSTRFKSGVPRKTYRDFDKIESGLYLQWQNTRDTSYDRAKAQFDTKCQPEVSGPDSDGSPSDVLRPVSEWFLMKPRKHFAYSFGLQPPVFPQEI